MRIAPVGHAGDVKHRVLPFQRIKAGVIAEGPFGAHLRKIHVAFEHDFRLRRHFQRAGLAGNHLHRLAPQESREHHLVQVGRNGQDAGQAGDRVGADGHGHVDAAVADWPRARGENVPRRAFAFASACPWCVSSYTCMR